MSRLVSIMRDLLFVATEQLAFLYLDTVVSLHFRLSPDSEVVTIIKCILLLNSFYAQPVKLISEAFIFYSFLPKCLSFISAFPVNFQ